MSDKKPEEQPENIGAVATIMIAVIAIVLYAVWPRPHPQSARDLAISDCMNALGENWTAKERLNICKSANP